MLAWIKGCSNQKAKICQNNIILALWICDTLNFFHHFSQCFRFQVAAAASACLRARFLARPGAAKMDDAHSWTSKNLGQWWTCCDVTGRTRPSTAKTIKKLPQSCYLVIKHNWTMSCKSECLGQPLFFLFCGQRHGKKSAQVIKMLYLLNGDWCGAYTCQGDL